MAQTGCPVNETIAQIKGLIESNQLIHPRARRIAEEILDLLNDTAWGRAGEKHLPAIQALAKELLTGDFSEAGREAGQMVESALTEFREVFVSHVETGNCLTGDCVNLSPAPCQTACPAGIDVPTYLSLIGLGRDAEAIDIIREDNPFPWVCGLVCTRPCEFMCVRGRIDTPISIKFLKAFAAERALSENRYVNPPKAPDKEEKVCVVGAGPGGLSAAYYLSLEGYQVTVLESLPVAGGMIMVGIPRYRLPREVIDREVAMLEELGVTFRFDTAFGSDVIFEDLQADNFKAFFFAIGAHNSFQLNIPGEENYTQIIQAIDFLRDVALGDRHIPGKKVIVIGGGNVAIDAARTCLRLGSREVTIAYRRTRTEMPADEEEVEQAEEEGIHFEFLAVPLEMVGKDEHLIGLKCLRAKMEAVEGGKRMRPVPIPDSEYVIEADAVIYAIGQQVDHACMESVADLKWTRRGTIDVNMSHMQTNLPGVFAAGDAVTGPATVIEAIGGGKRAAEAIDRYLSGIPQPTMPPVPVRRGRVEWMEVPAATKMALKRPEMPLLNIDRRRTTFQQVELGYSENMIREEARRCLRCDICRRCGDCVAVCRDMMKIDALELGYFDFDHPVETDFRRVEERCIACGACAKACTNNAMQIEDRGDERILSICGTILNRQKLLFCESCGATIGPAKYLDYIKRKTGQAGPVALTKELCENCSRKAVAKSSIPPPLV